MNLVIFFEIFSQQVSLKRLAEGMNLCEGGQSAKWIVYTPQEPIEKVNIQKKCIIKAQIRMTTTHFSLS
jgi:hypothetical protein